MIVFTPMDIYNNYIEKYKESNLDSLLFYKTNIN